MFFIYLFVTSEFILYYNKVILNRVKGYDFKYDGIEVFHPPSR